MEIKVLAKALYDFQANGPGELAMKSGDMVGLRWKVDDNWYYGDIKGSSGLIPASMVQVLGEPTQPAPLCRALYDFDLNRLGPGDRKECLAFVKGDVISLIKRVDENWGEGKLGDKVGIFPLQFTEPIRPRHTSTPEERINNKIDVEPSPGSVVEIMLSDSEDDRPSISDHVAKENQCYREYMDVYAPVITEEDDELVATAQCLDLPEPIEVQGSLTAPDIISNLALAIDRKRVSRFNIMRSNVWDGAVRGFKRVSYSEFTDMFVKFSDDAGTFEEGLDTGGPRRELLTLLMSCLQYRPIFDGPPSSRYLVYNSVAVREDEYFLAGKMIAVSIVHGGPGPHFLSQDLVNHIVNQTTFSATLKDVTDEGIVKALQEPNPTAFKLLAGAKPSDLAELRPRNTRVSSTRVSLDADSHRRLSRTHASPARPPDVSVLNTLNHGQIQSSTAPSATLKPGRISTISKPRSGSTQRSPSKGERKMNGEVPPTITMALINPQTLPPQAEGKPSPIQQLSISVCAALYSYTPHRAEELELSKGEMVGVYGKFKEGWLRGLSLRTGKVGILPANYVTPVLRTSAMFLEPPKLAVPTAAAASLKRYTSQNPQGTSLPLDKVKVEVAAPVGAMAPQAAVASGSAVKSPQAGGKQGWDTVRRAFQTPHRGSFRHSSYHPQNPGSSLHPPPQDLGQIYGFGRSPVLPRKRNGLFTNPIRSQHWTHEGTTPSAGAFQTMETKYMAPKETSTAPQSILIKPDVHRHNTEKPVKTVRFLTEDVPPPATRLSSVSSVSSGTQVMSNSQSGSAALEHWNPSAIIGRDGSTSVFKDLKTIMQRKGPSQNNASADCLPLGGKLYASNSQSSPVRHRVLKGYNAKTDAELNLLEGELVLVQKPRSDGRVLVKQEKTGVTGIFQCSILDILDKVG